MCEFIEHNLATFMELSLRTMQLFWSLLNSIPSLRSYIWHAFYEILVLIVSVCAVYIAIQSKRQARIAAQMNLFYQHMARYSSIEMHKALGIIGKLSYVRKEQAVFLECLKKYHNKECIKDLEYTKGALKTGYHLDLKYEDINNARRQVSHFFTFLFDLYAV